MYLPGENSLCFSHPIYYVLLGFIDDEITVKGEVLSKSKATRIITLKTTITDSYGNHLIEGQAKVLVRE